MKKNEIMEVYSRLPNELFFTNDKKMSILQRYKDNKIVILYHYLYVMSNLEGNCITTMGMLMKRCGYKETHKSLDSFKKSLENLIELNLIEVDLTHLALNKPIIINTYNLLRYADDNNFVTLSNKEIEIIKLISSNIKSVLCHLKVYLNIKARCYKPQENFIYDINNPRYAVATYMTYARISIESTVNDNYISKYLHNLQAFGLISYKNYGYRYGKGKYDEQWKESPDIFTINLLPCFIEKKTTIENELNLMFKLWLKQKQDEGYKIRKTKENNQINNKRKGWLSMRVATNKATKEEINELEKLKK